jgi:hypothetical protein
MSEDCKANGLKYGHNHLDFLYFKLVTAVPFLTALVGLWRASAWLAPLYLAWVALHVTVVYRLLCTHCPHYGASDGKTNCHFIWRTPAIFKQRPGPQGLGSKLGLVLMLAASSLFPVYWLARDPALLIIYLLSLCVLFATMMRYECTRCVHLDCPKNQVPGNVRKDAQAKAETPSG